MPGIVVHSKCYISLCFFYFSFFSSGCYFKLLPAIALIAFCAVLVTFIKMGFFAYTPDQFLIQVKVSFFSILPFYQSFKSLLLLLLLLFFCYIKCLIMIIITIADYYYYWFFSNNNQQYYCFFCSFSTCSDLPLFPNFIFFSFLFWFVFCLCFYFCCFLSLFLFLLFFVFVLFCFILFVFFFISFSVLLLIKQLLFWHETVKLSKLLFVCLFDLFLQLKLLSKNSQSYCFSPVPKDL